MHMYENTYFQCRSQQEMLQAKSNVKRDIHFQASVCLSFNTKVFLRVDTIACMCASYVVLEISGLGDSVNVDDKR